MSHKSIQSQLLRSETLTENIFRKFYGSDMFIEKSAISSHYGFKSKNRTDKQGYPDFFRDNDDEDFVIIVEAKADDYKSACSDVKFYSEQNNLNKDIVAIAISGQTEDTYKAGLFLLIKGMEWKEVETDGRLLPIKDIIRLYRLEKYGESVSTESLKNTIKRLNKEFQKHNIKDTERSLFFAGLMIALKDRNFASQYRLSKSPTKDEQEGSRYKMLESHNLNMAILDAIVKQISNKINNNSKEYSWKDRFSFIKNIDYPLNEYISLIDTIERNIFLPFRQDEKQDILGRAYKIFLAKAGKIDNKNIILTPDHIKTLMVDLARISVNDVVLDTCTGSGGFLMEAMERLVDKAGNKKEIIDRIKDSQLIGFEIDPTLFALACSNMFLHGDGRTNLIYGSSLVSKSNDVYRAVKRYKPNKCIINPPYENNMPILFTKTAIDFLEPDGRLVIIMPTVTLNRNVGGLTDEILKIAKLDFVIKMPNNLFSEQGRTVNTSIFGFTKTPHDKSDTVVFYNMDDDGLVSVQHKGRIDKNGRWNTIKDNVIKCVKHGKDVDGEYDRLPIFHGNTLNCYGIKDSQSSDGLVPLGILFEWKRGTLQSENNQEGDYDFITASEEWKTHNEYEYDCEALVYAVSAGGSLGRSHYANGKFVASNLCLVLTPTDNRDYPVDLRFYNIYLNAIRKRIVNELADGTSKLTISPEDLMDYMVDYFPIDTQREIADYYEKHVLAAEKRLQSAKEKMASRMRDLLG